MEAIILLGLLGGLLLYPLPIIVSHTRKTRHRGSITLVNLFMGWTLLGWLVAAMWACTERTD